MKRSGYQNVNYENLTKPTLGENNQHDLIYFIPFPCWFEPPAFRPEEALNLALNGDILNVRSGWVYPIPHEPSTGLKTGDLSKH